MTNIAMSAVVTWLFAAWLLVAPPQAPAARVASLSWLAGCWTMTSSGNVVEEQWMRPSGGTMLGMSRTVRNGKTTEYEFLQIREEADRLVYDARPSGQAPASFPLREISPDRVVFEDPAHDFPQRILYTRNADGSVTARVEASRNGQVRGIDYPYQRCR